MPLASSHRLRLTPGHRRSISPNTGSAENRSSADSRTNIRSPPDSPAPLREEAGHRHDRVFEPHRVEGRRESAAPSSRGESHPPALTDPYVTVSRHTALVVLVTRPWGRRLSMPSGRRTRAVL